VSKRPPAAPPQLPGFEYIQLLGSGGFADVFLYEQQLPRRRVAVKVLLPDRLESAGQQFASEANVMAMLSNHPAIVTILQAGMSTDQRPYIVMEYCPRPNLQMRYRRAPFSVSESLHTAIPVIAAVETAHRMGVLHRDIKPANVLVTEYNRPALTDFGIAAHAETAEAAAGMSIPWSPPESFENPPRNGPTTDVYQLGATLYTLLAGRAPFEIPGQRNSSAELIDRAERMPLMRLDRPDVPHSLQVALARAMAKRPEDRYQTAVALARALQKVQIELEHSVTPIDILDDAPTDEFDDVNDGLTRVRNVTNIVPDDPRGHATTRRGRRGAADDVDDVTTIRGGALDDATTIVPPRTGRSSAADHETIRRGQGAAAPAAAETVVPDAQPGWVGPDAGGRPGAEWAAPGVPAASPADGGQPAAAAPAWSPNAAAGGALDSSDTLAPGTPASSGFSGARAASSGTAGAASVAASDRKPRWPWLVGGGVLVAALLVGAAFVLPQLLGDEPDPVIDDTTQPKDPVTETPPAVADLKAEVAGDEITFSWTNPDPEDGDTYQWGIDAAGSAIEFHDTRETSVTVDNDGPTCVEVYLVRVDGVASPASAVCTT